jgi:LacI family transcriptional regulator
MSVESEKAQQRISIRDLARMLGVSHATVSLALRDHPRISQKVKEKVKHLAEEVGYRPDPMLSALANYRRSKETLPITAGVAWINAWPNPGNLKKYREFDAYWKGASKAAEKFGYRLEEFRLGGDCTPRRLHQILSTRDIRGLLLPPHQNEPDWQDFPWENYSVVRFGRSLKVPECHLVTADQIANTMLAVRKIHERGYKRIGFVAQEGDLSRRGMLFELGFLGGLRVIREENPIPVLILDRSGDEERLKALQAWIGKHKPDAIFTTDAEMSKLLGSLGVKIPQDIALAVTSILDAHCDAGIDQHPEEIGRVGFLMLNSLMNDRARGIPQIFRQILVEGSWTDGDSLPQRD